MCRLAAYLGPQISLAKFLLEPSHSLYRQSWEPKEMKEAVLNADGFGFGWWGNSKRASTYTNSQPIWADSNLPDLGNALHSGLWLANVRSATLGQAVMQANNQPFNRVGLLYTHNGYIDGFNPYKRQFFHRILSAEIQSGIQGNTDSEYLFALLCQYLSSADNLLQCVQNMLATLEKIVQQETALLNMLISDGDELCIIRHAKHGECPSLYYSITEPDFPDAILVASEPLTSSASWLPIPEHSISIVSAPSHPKFISL